MSNNCYSCKVELEPVFDSGDKPYTGQQFKNALIVAFMGGYGMAIDNIEAQNDARPDYEAVICERCIYDLTDIPWIAHLLEIK